jgi:hypothetical protein
MWIAKRPLFTGLLNCLLFSAIGLLPSTLQGLAIPSEANPYTNLSAEAISRFSQK